MSPVAAPSRAMPVDATGPWCSVTRGDGPLVAVALHAGHAIRPELQPLLALTDEQRRREEDPYTDRLTTIVPSRLIAHRSRFEVDLNRSRKEAVYLRPEQAWGLTVWKEALPDEILEASLALHDAFYAAVSALLANLAARHGRFVVLDLHSYNHRRAGPDAEPDDPAGAPEINVGTGSLSGDPWRPLVERFMAALRGASYHGRSLDVRENVNFRGGHFPRWVHATFPDSGCCLALEIKKFFMDEWSGELDPLALPALEQVLARALPTLRAELQRL